MPTGRVKVFHPDRNFGFLSDDDGREVFFHADAVSGEPAGAGDVVEFDVVESDGARQDKEATNVAVTHRASADLPVGRTLAQPPTWDELEERERQRRAARRRRR